MEPRHNGTEDSDSRHAYGYPPGLTREQERAYIVQLQIEDLTRKLRTGDLGIPPNPEDRSPSP